MKWVPRFLPLAKGLDLSKEATLGTDDLTIAQNVDFTVDGQVRGRPSRQAPAPFVLRAGGYPVDWDAPAAFDTLGFTPLGIEALRDRSGTRPVLLANGRCWSKEGTRWVDRGAFACMRVDRLAQDRSTNSAAARMAFAPDFMLREDTTAVLLTPSLAVDRVIDVDANGVGPGNGARCGTTTAAVFYAGAGTVGMYLRHNGGDTLTYAEMATNAASVANDGDAPCITSDGSHFFVSYVMDEPDNVAVLKVNPANGTVLESAALGFDDTVDGHWLAVHDDYVAVAGTGVFGVSVQFRYKVDLTTGSEYPFHTVAAEGSLSAKEVVIGVSADGRIYTVHRETTGALPGNLKIIHRATADDDTVDVVETLQGGTEAAGIRWAILHQPIVADGRLYVTLAAAAGASSTTATWQTLDLTDWGDEFGLRSDFPTTVAAGPANATAPHAQPSAAFALDDGFGFRAFQWGTFDAAKGENWTDPEIVGTRGAWGTNLVRLSRPRAAQADAGTVFSGSVPRWMAGGDCHELGFPFLSGVPRVSAAGNTSGGTMADGSYTVTACWRWVDESGLTHRSSPARPQTVTIAGGSGTGSISVSVTNPWLAGRDRVAIEVYCTEADPVAESSRFLQATVTPGFASANTLVDLTTPPDLTTEPLYTDGGAFAHVHVPGDGGVATVGRRIWLATGNRVFASKLQVAGAAPGWSDAGPLQVDLPAGVGRILALEGLDDKLVVLCERGLFIVQDGGPSNVGGPDFAPPLRVSDLGIAGPRSSCLTDRGVVFCSPLDATDPSRGGPWLLDRSFTIHAESYLGRQALQYHLGLAGWVPEVAFSPERQQLYVSAPNAPGGTGLVVIDLRVGKWALWDHRDDDHGALRSLTTVGGVLWTLGDEPAPYAGAPGSDAAGPYEMRIVTAHHHSNGQDGLGWARVRSVRALSNPDSGAHTLRMYATLDGRREVASAPFVLGVPGDASTWPSDRHAPEWRLPTQKCSSIQVELSATPATARWAAIRLDVKPLPPTAPARYRK
jgi:hypothetical protein